MRYHLALSCAIAAAALLATLAAIGADPKDSATGPKLDAPPKTSAPEPPDAEPAAGVVDLRGFSGASGCAAANCHNGARLAGKPAWSSSYKVWLAADPHARAYRVLLEPRSLEIARLLGEQRLGAMTAATAERCLTCHSMQPADDHTLLPEKLLAEGISCEACHGRAEKWRALHYLGDWKTNKADGAAKELGFHDTKSLVASARDCAGCHVGGLGREVDHDLIAAGHPRLTFELAAFQKRMPRHWDVPAETFAGEGSARAWAVGQAVALEATASVLAERAAGADGKQRSWPEFSEYDCFACHHDLQDRSWRRDRPKGEGLGLAEWGTWQAPLSTAVAHRSLSVFGVDGAGVEKELTALDAAMHLAWRSDNRDAVKKSAASVAKSAGEWAAALDHDAKLDRARGAKLLAWAAADEDHLSNNWDGAAQVCLAVMALGDGRHGANATDDPQAEALRALLKKLEFPRDYASPPHFTPDDFQAELAKIRKALDAHK